MVRVLPFERWRSRFMQETDPKKGNKIAIRIENIQPSDIPAIRSLLAGIQEKYINYALIYFPTFFERDKRARVFTFNRLSNLPEAVQMFRMHLHANHPSWILPVWVGGYTLYVTIEINDETAPILRKLQKKAIIPKNYTGRRL